MKNLLIALLLSPFALMSCQKEEIIIEEHGPHPKITNIRMNYGPEVDQLVMDRNSDFIVHYNLSDDQLIKAHHLKLTVNDDPEVSGYVLKPLISDIPETGVAYFIGRLTKVAIRGKEYPTFSGDVLNFTIHVEDYDGHCMNKYFKIILE